MQEYDRRAPLEFGEHRRELRIGQRTHPHARRERDAVRAELVERAADLFERRVDVRHRQGREEAEAGGMPAAKLGVLVVAVTRRAHRRG